jgi:hypothetical protein
MPTKTGQSGLNYQRVDVAPREETMSDPLVSILLGALVLGALVYAITCEANR